MRGRCLAGIVLVLSFGPWPGVAAFDYHLGEGYRVGRLDISGYLNVEAEWEGARGKALQVDDISLLLSGAFGRWFNPFLELELTGIEVVRDGTRGFSNNAGDFVVERAYNQIDVNGGLDLRIGKMLSPVGYWNQIHAAPLVWTAVRPLTTRRNFSSYVSGLSLGGRLPGGRASWTVYAQPTSELLPQPRDHVAIRYRDVYGFDLRYETGFDEHVELSVQHGERMRESQTHTLVSIDVRQTIAAVDLQAQATYAWLGSEHRLARVRDEEWGAYVQLRAPLARHWSLVGRLEGFSDRARRGVHRNWLAGVVFHPYPTFRVKLEYLGSGGPRLGLSPGLRGALAIFF